MAAATSQHPGDLPPVPRKGVQGREGPRRPGSQSLRHKGGALDLGACRRKVRCPRHRGQLLKEGTGQDTWEFVSVRGCTCSVRGSLAHTWHGRQSLLRLSCSVGQSAFSKHTRRDEQTSFPMS